MKKKTTNIRISTFKFLLFLPLFLLSFCDSNLEEPILNSENRLSQDSKVLLLMKAAVQNDSDQNLTKNKSTSSKSTATEEDDQCTYFLYPMTFEVYSGDDPNPDLREINSDEELITFIDAFAFEEELSIATTPNYELYIFFPITLLDADGVETELGNLTELEGTLQMAVEACASLNDESSDSNDVGVENNSNDESNDGNSNDNDDAGSNDGGNNESANNESDDAGIHNAHFDVDTSHLVYDFNDGETDAHTHEYDEKYDTNIVDYFNILNDDKKNKKGLRNINDLEFGVPNDSEQFYIIIANADLSQDVQLEINGDLISVMDYQNKVDAYLNGDQNALGTYSLGGSSDATQLKSLKFIVGYDAASVKNGLIPTETKTVVKNTQGPNGEYRDGALLIQAINKNKMSLYASLGVADQDADLYWESTIFWHVKQKGNNKETDDDSNSDYNYCDKKKKKVSICHKGKTICVSVNAIWGHMQHHKDDYLGGCDD